MQRRVRAKFAQLQQQDDQVTWHTIDASQSMESVEQDMWNVIEATRRAVQSSKKPLAKLWEEGYHEVNVGEAR
jgi:hypothetical protein